MRPIGYWFLQCTLSKTELMRRLLNLNQKNEFFENIKKDMSQFNLRFDNAIAANVSTTFLQRKFKISLTLAQQIIDILHALQMHEIWIDVTKDLPQHGEEVIVKAKPLMCDSVNTAKFHIAYLDAHCGWLDAQSKEHLYVHSWMREPQKESDLGSSGDPADNLT